jgi:hypothetical protein
MWTHIKPLFKKEFVTVSDDKLIIDGLANLAYRPNDNLGCISPGWRSCFMSSRRVTPHTVSNPNDQHSKLWVAT